MLLPVLLALLGSSFPNNGTHGDSLEHEGAGAPVLGKQTLFTFDDASFCNIHNSSFSEFSGFLLSHGQSTGPNGCVARPPVESDGLARPFRKTTVPVGRSIIERHPFDVFTFLDRDLFGTFKNSRGHASYFRDNPSTAREAHGVEENYTPNSATIRADTVYRELSEFSKVFGQGYCIHNLTIAVRIGMVHGQLALGMGEFIDIPSVSFADDDFLSILKSKVLHGEYCARHMVEVSPNDHFLHQCITINIRFYLALFYANWMNQMYADCFYMCVSNGIMKRIITSGIDSAAILFRLSMGMICGTYQFTYAIIMDMFIIPLCIIPAAVNWCIDFICIFSCYLALLLPFAGLMCMITIIVKLARSCTPRWRWWIMVYLFFFREFPRASLPFPVGRRGAPLGMRRPTVPGPAAKPPSPALPLGGPSRFTGRDAPTAGSKRLE